MGDEAIDARGRAAFHRHIVVACGNALMRDVWDQLGVRARTALYVARPDCTLAAALQEHRDIVSAIQSGRAGEASGLTMQHILSAVADPASEA